jgi:uncharacterized protein (TIGR00369 family)
MHDDPQHYEIPADYRHWVGDAAEDHIGPFFFRNDGALMRTALRVQPHHCNAHQTVHGGVLMAFADYTLCLCANGGTQQSVITINCNNAFVAPAELGELIEGHGEVIKRGKSLVFVRGDLKVDDRIILTSTGVVKLIVPKAG